MASSSSEVAQATFILNNSIADISADEVFRYDKAAQQAILAAKPWSTDPNYFKKVRVSAIALIKMVSRPPAELADRTTTRGGVKQLSQLD